MIGNLIPIYLIRSKKSIFRNDEIYGSFTDFSLSEVYLIWMTFDLIFFGVKVYSRSSPLCPS